MDKNTMMQNLAREFNKKDSFFERTLNMAEKIKAAVPGVVENVFDIDDIPKMTEEIKNELKRLRLNWDEISSDVSSEVYFTPYVRIDSEHRHGKQYLDFAITLNLLNREYHTSKPVKKWEFIPDED